MQCEKKDNLAPSKHRKVSEGYKMSSFSYVFKKIVTCFTAFITECTESTCPSTFNGRKQGAEQSC